MSALETSNKIAISAHLSLFKEKGIVKYERVLCVPSEIRIPALTKTPEGRVKVITALSAAITSAFNNLNLKFGTDEDQVIELADQIIDQSHEDNLAMEDVLLFLQKLLVGDCGKLYDRMDMPLFFEKFESYRQERHAQMTCYNEVLAQPGKCQHPRRLL